MILTTPILQPTRDTKQFQGAESLSEPVKIGFEIELDLSLIESTFPEFQPNTCDLTTIKKNFCQLVNILTFPIEYGSGYYWEIRQIYLVTRKKEFTGCVMHAIDRRLKDKKLKSTGYLKNKAIETHQQFNFIELLWIPNSSTGSLCPDDKFKEVINMHIEISERNNTGDEIIVKLTYYEKVFNSALKLYQREKDNIHYVKSFDSLIKSVIQAVEECEKKLAVHTQQST
ncbi:8822_t:CDS:2 [Funneliformis geosporum]|uniref:7573_t:CDS:1 n=1 Tax=Funneliformis geosporum TaxID=1117311 RepID=A0A9W4WS51_9GLOM|nr:8822_t:CDS:2 [Funneliformis geosporum]CAI2182163.1 7573_t:CDS:2 [Funneliformis geosporum]